MTQAILKKLPASYCFPLHYLLMKLLLRESEGTREKKQLTQMALHNCIMQCRHDQT